MKKLPVIMMICATIILTLTSCATTKRHVYKTPTPWVSLTDGCEKTNDPDVYACKKTALGRVYRETLDLAEANAHLRVDLGAALDVSAIEKRELKKDKHFWKVAALVEGGVIIAAILGVGLGLGI